MFIDSHQIRNRSTIRSLPYTVCTFQHVDITAFRRFYLGIGDKVKCKDDIIGRNGFPISPFCFFVQFDGKILVICRIDAVCQLRRKLIDFRHAQQCIIHKPDGKLTGNTRIEQRIEGIRRIEHADGQRFFAAGTATAAFAAAATSSQHGNTQCQTNS